MRHSEAGLTFSRLALRGPALCRPLLSDRRCPQLSYPVQNLLRSTSGNLYHTLYFFGLTPLTIRRQVGYLFKVLDYPTSAHTRKFG